MAEWSASSRTAGPSPGSRASTSVKYAHLQAVSQPFSELAAKIHATVPRNAERSVALRRIGRTGALLVGSGRKQSGR
jgi:hypothetical protein